MWLGVGEREPAFPGHRISFKVNIKQAYGGCWTVSNLILPVRRNYVSSRDTEVFFFTVLNRFKGGAFENLRLGFAAHAPPGPFVLTVVPSVSGLRDEQGDVVAGQKVQQASPAPWGRSRSVSKHSFHVGGSGQRQHPGEAGAC